MPDVKIGVSQHSLNASKGVAFSGTQAIYAPNTVLTEPGVDGMTMVAWVTVPSGTSRICPMAVNDSSRTEVFHGLLINQFDVDAYSREASFISSRRVHGTAVGDLVHVAGVWSSTTSRTVYANGLPASESTDLQVPTGIDTFSLGCLEESGTLTRAFTGAIYHAAWYNQARSPTEIAELAAGADPRNYPGLVRYLPLNGAANAANELIEQSTWTVAGTLADGAGDTTVTKQTFTNANLGGKTPKGALAFMTNATVADTVTANAHLSLGATDGVSEWVHASASEDANVTASQAVRFTKSDSLIASLSDDGTTVLGKSVFDGFSADSTELNHSNAYDAAHLLSLVQFAGDDLKVESGIAPFATTEDGDSVVTLADASLDADLIIFDYGLNSVTTGDGISPDGDYRSIGFAVKDGVSIGNYCVYRVDRDARNPTEVAAVVNNNRCVQALIPFLQFKSGEVTDISPGSFTLTSRDSSNATARSCGFLALSFGGAKVKAGTIETPTDASVDWNVTGVGFESQVVLSAWTAITGAYNTVKTDGEACSLNLWAFDANGAGSAGIRSQDAATTTSTDSRSGSDLLVRDNTGTTLVDLDTPVFNSDGWTVAAADIATANATARQGIYVAVEDVSATIAPITGSTSVAFGSSAYAAAINQIAGSTSFGFATAAQAAAINQIAASVTLQFTGTAALLNITPPPVVESGLWAESEDDRLSFFDLEEFGSTATINAAQVAGILEEPNVQIDVGEGPVMSASAPIFYCRTSDVSGIAIGQTVSISNPLKTGVFSVVEIRPDGDGITALVLHDA